MKIFELLAKHSWDDISGRFYELYPEQDRSGVAYNRAYVELLIGTVAEPNESCIMFRHIDTVYYDEEPYEDVYCMMPNDDVIYGLDFVRWSEVIGMNISEDALITYGEIDVVCHLMYELTFYGYSNRAIQVESDKIDELVKEIDRDNDLQSLESE